MQGGRYKETDEVGEHEWMGEMREVSSPLWKLMEGRGRESEREEYHAAWREGTEGRGVAGES